MITCCRSRETTLLKFFKGLTFSELAQAIGMDEVWVASAFYGQVCKGNEADLSIHSRHIQAKFTEEELKRLSEVLEISETEALGELGSHWYPNRGLGPVPPRDPVVYRLFEVCLFSYRIHHDVTCTT